MTQVLTIYFLKLKGVVMGHFNKDGEYIRLNNEPGKPENRRNESSGSEHSSSGGGGGVGCVIAIVAGIIIFLLFFIALIVGIGGNATGHWGFMLALLKIVWWPYQDAICYCVGRCKSHCMDCRQDNSARPFNYRSNQPSCWGDNNI